MLTSDARKQQAPGRIGIYNLVRIRATVEDKGIYCLDHYNQMGHDITLLYWVYSFQYTAKMCYHIFRQF